MGQTYELAPWLTLRGTSGSTAEIIQRRDTWVDVDSFKEAVICIQVLTHNNCTLSIQTAVMPEGPWTSIADFTASTNTTKNFSSSQASTDKFQRFLRRKLARPAATWETGSGLKPMCCDVETSSLSVGKTGFSAPTYLGQEVPDDIP